MHSVRQVHDPREQKALLREGALLRTLRHPGLLRVFAAVGGTGARELGFHGSQLGLLSEPPEMPLAAALADNVRPDAERQLLGGAYCRLLKALDVDARGLALGVRGGVLPQEACSQRMGRCHTRATGPKR